MIKKIGFLVLTLLMISSVSTAQESVILKQTFLPNSIYKSTMEMTIGSEMMFGDDPNTTPTVSNGVTLMHYSILSGEAIDDKIPVVIKYDSLVTKQYMGMSDTPMEMVLFKGTKIYGSYDKKSSFSLDSIVGDLDATMRTTLEETLKQFSQAINFPEKAMKIGDNFNQEMPFSIPMPGQEPLEMVIKTNYTLTEIKEGIAYFDLVQDYIMNSDQELGEMKMTGDGTGKLTFDIENNFALVVETDAKSVLVMKMGEMVINAKSNTYTKVVTEFSRK